MSDTFRAMCAELVDDLEEWVDGYLINDPADEHTSASFERINRARALLARPEPEGPSADELMDMAEFFIEDNGLLGLHNAGEFACAVLDRWGRPTPQPPADGEVVELVARLHGDGSAMSSQSGQMWWDLMASSSTAQRDHLNDITRAVELLQRQHPQPVAVSERPWEREGWCDEQGRCWAWHPFDPENDETGDYWSRIPWHWIDDIGIWSHCLPANALPIPEAQ
tara:strand:- start:14324 stop:14995 length:672 start_codon:yes stop_codon:yes gene_type:complete